MDICFYESLSISPSYRISFCIINIMKFNQLLHQLLQEKRKLYYSPSILNNEHIFKRYTVAPKIVNLIP